MNATNVDKNKNCFLTTQL